MTTDESNKAAFLQALLTSPGERQQVEYKSAVPFDENTDFGLKLVKHILGMANTGGGWIVIGYDDSTLQPDPDHSAESAATYDTTRISQAVNSCVERGQSIRLSIDLPIHPETSLSHQVIQVEGFDRTPLICRSTKSASDTGEQVLQSGRVYIRRPGAATSEVRTQSDWDELLKRVVSRRRDEFLQEFADLFRRLSMGDATPQEDSMTRLNIWREEQYNASGIRESVVDGGAYMESAHILVRQQGQEWDLTDLRKAASSERWVHYLNGIIPKQDGIEVRIEQSGSFLLPEYWHLDKRGSCYYSGLMREDFESPGFSSSGGHPERMLWLDLAIHRIGLELWTSAALYRELGVSPDEPYLFLIKHAGLEERTIYAYRPFDFLPPYPQKSKEPSHLWQREVTQDIVRSQLIDLTHEIANSLSGLFGFTQVPKSLVMNLLGKSHTYSGQRLVPSG